MPTTWFILRDGTQFGPLNDDEFRALAQQGGLNSDDLLWHDGAPHWFPAAPHVVARANLQYEQEYRELPPEEYEEPRRSRGSFMILVALVGAIALGGALAYGYKTFLASSETRIPHIKAVDYSLNKIRPADAGKTDVANTDKKILNRLGEEGDWQKPGGEGSKESRVDDDPNAPRKVRVVPVSPGEPSPPTKAASTKATTVPGIILETLDPPQAAASPALSREAPSPAKLGQAASPMEMLPNFPWPPPAASASYVLPSKLLQGSATIGQVIEAIISALERRGYVERSLFRTEGDGIVLVTRLERINDDGSPLHESERWPVGLKQSAADLGEFLKGLFFVDAGRYRVIVFVLQEAPFSQSTNRITGDVARNWLREGANVLPRQLAELPFAGYVCTALVYEFASDGNAVRLVESRLTGKQHLDKAGVLALLAKAN